ncbi:MAG: hypothetical protein A3C35_01965 [Omnitrophica bacterium RIFCSPHIGHO2_02_FULL_46_11]|nr:MAG: hypothetical protein A3C35_01965 [Omnitrophica bacterium RIFCSPHIGHO2_02_FULL_46_11]OGW85825.1 MAG: hypothetical protein A3A81_07230 [Omnitrophica bacterium RIFCSPLOWO2_01_FULL_45_10b]
MIKKFKLAVENFKKELRVYQLVLTDPKTPKLSKWLLGLAVAYFLSPVDLIPDFIPLLGQLDDLILIPLLVWLAIRMIPKAIVEDCRNQANSE